MTVRDSQILATYAAFTDKTLFLVDESLAAEIVLGKAAVIRHEMGRGHLQLYGPHFEHPHFSVANELLIRALYWDMPYKRLSDQNAPSEAMKISGREAKQFIRDIKRQISNGRIVATGLEILPISWQIGNKIYEAGKIRVFLDAIWQRIRILETLEKVLVSEREKSILMKNLLDVVTILRAVKREPKQTEKTSPSGLEMFAKLSDACALFLNFYFRSLADILKR